MQNVCHICQACYHQLMSIYFCTENTANYKKSAILINTFNIYILAETSTFSTSSDELLYHTFQLCDHVMPSNLQLSTCFAITVYIHLVHKCSSDTVCSINRNKGMNYTVY